MKLVKFFLYTMGYILSRVGDEPPSIANNEESRTRIEILKQTLSTVTCNADHTMRASASKLAQHISEEMLTETSEGEKCRNLFSSVLKWSLPDVETIQALLHLAWASSTGSYHLLEDNSLAYGQETSLPEAIDYAVCKEALEVLSFSLVLNQVGFELLSLNSNWSDFITSLILMNGSRYIRQTATEQIFYMFTYCAPDRKPFVFLIDLLTETLNTIILKHSADCSEFFQLFCRLLRFGLTCNWSLSSCDVLLKQEIEWILLIRDNVKKSGDTGVHDDLLEGRLNLIKELVVFLQPEEKAKYNNLIIELVDDFLFPASKQHLHYRQKGYLLKELTSPPVCRNPRTISAACELLVSLCTNCIPNLKLLSNTLMDMFFYGKYST
jgi:ubiquitin carboxyl-terminal hydrolase 9/24